MNGMQQNEGKTMKSIQRICRGGALVGFALATLFGINANAGPAYRLVFTTQPATLVAGKVLHPNPEVQIQDKDGNNVRLKDVTITLVLHNGSISKGKTDRKSGPDGNVAFGGLQIDKPGAGMYFTAHVDGLADATTVAFNVTPVVAGKLTFATQPGDTKVGMPMSKMVVRIQDEFGNNIPQPGALVSLNLNTGATLGGTTSVATDASGTATFTDLTITSVAGNTSQQVQLLAAASDFATANSASFTALPANIANVSPTPHRAVSLTGSPAAGSVTVAFAGAPNFTYLVQAATSLDNPVWTTISTNTAGADGTWAVVDRDAGKYSTRFYRSTVP
jgi:hypothetical protein